MFHRLEPVEGVPISACGNLAYAWPYSELNSNETYFDIDLFSRLDEYIENYVRETGQEFKSKSSTPEAEASKLRHELSNDSSGIENEDAVES